MMYIIFDLEATCWENERSKLNEIIEVGAVKIDDTLEIKDTFSRFVRPEINPELSEFCKKLTSISQKDVDGARPLKQEMKDFEKWISSDEDEVYLCSWGFYDKKQILKECKEKKYSGLIFTMLDKHISIKHQFAKIKNIRPCGMKSALEMMGIPLEGVHHRGIDDAINISKIFIAVFKDLKLLNGWQ